MHRHDHDELATDVQPDARVRTAAPDAMLMKAAAAGRVDVLGVSGLLGVQRAAGNAAATTVVQEEQESSSVHDVVARGGQPLDDHVRSDMEARMGQDFSDVRVHTDDAADASARSVSAHAYTVGSNIVFQRGAYDPGSGAGKTTLAHELTHVVQQRSGPVEGTPVGGGISVSDPSDRFERAAVANAEQVMSQPAPVQRDQTSAAGAGVGTVPIAQREEAEEEEVQALHDNSSVQRQEDEQLEEEPQA